MKNKLYKALLFISLFPISIFAQELDKAFLDSLPDDIAKDVIARNDQRDEIEKPQYRRPTTFIKKPEATSTRFGADIFSMMQSTLMPINEPNLDSSYILDFGDELQLQLVGQKSSTDKLSIKRDGSINIEDIGKVFISGLSLGEAVSLIQSRINESFIGVRAFVTLTNVRDIQVIMTGNVFNPGSYTLNGNSNVFHALSIAGGPSELGSFRSIELIRNNKKIETIDLYQTFIFGKPSFNSRLRSGDIIFVNSVNNVITLSGSVKRPGEYELLPNENLSEVIIFGNGIDKYADLKNIKLDRILDGKIKSIAITNLTQFNNISSKDGDRIFIRAFPFRAVEVSGAVLNPGTYLMNEGDTLMDVIEKSGGYSVNAYPFGGIYENEFTKQINKLAIESLYNDFLDNIFEIQSQSGDDAGKFLDVITELKNTPASGRVIANFDINNTENETTIKDGDKITIPEYSNQVYVYGEVASEGTALFSKGEDISFYVDKKGGLNPKADRRSIYVLQPNGETFRFAPQKNVFVSKTKDIPIYPGSIIFVPKQLNNEYASRLRAQAYTSIFSNLAVSLASVSVLKN